MRALETERSALTLSQVAVPTAAVGERRRGGRTSRHLDIPTAGRVGRLAEIQRHRPATDRTRAVVGNSHVQLVTVAPDTRRSHRTAVRTKCMTGQQQADQQHSCFDYSFHISPRFCNRFGPDGAPLHARSAPTP